MEQAAQAAEALLAESTGEEALGHAIRAAELYMQAASELSISKSDATRLRRRCNELIAHAERIKSAVAATGNDAAGIIRRASRLHNSYFPQWVAEPLPDEFQQAHSAEHFTDHAHFTLSTAQNEIFAGWKRPQELWKIPSDSKGEDAFMSTTSHSCLVQDVTTDCSVVASLCAAGRVLTGKHLALSSIIYPFDHANRRPKVSENGKYVIRLYFNGCARRVVIDDRLPSSRTSRSLFVFDKHTPTLLWPALIEKAYLKVRGGYDFPGSNSGTDLWVMTGWIPEQLFLSREDLDIDETWERIKLAHDSDDVIITLGTGQISAEEESTMGLVGEHDYAVQLLYSSNNTRKLLLKNPWSNSPELRVTGWSSPRGIRGGDFACQDNTTPREDEQRENDKGLLWVDLEDVVQNFESMYLNWNPALFHHRRDFHFGWNIPPKVFSPTLAKNPQFSVEAPTDTLIWILISRHFNDGELEIARRKTDSMAATARELGFMSILIFDNRGRRVQIGESGVFRGPLVDSPQTLARFRAEPRKAYTVVLDHQGLPLSNYTFTMSVFSNAEVHATEATEQMEQVTEETGAWTRRTAGGNASHTTYFVNPQYSLTVQRSTSLSILLSTDNRDVHVHIDLVWASGNRVVTVRAKDILASSGEYRRGCALLDIPNIAPGVYTVVCSTFEPGQHGTFVLRLTSAESVSTALVPVVAAGRLRTPLPGFILQGGDGRRRAPLSASRLTRACVSARGAKSNMTQQGDRDSSDHMIRISVIHGSGPDEVIIAVSGDGEFEESTMVVRTTEFDIEPDRAKRDGLWIVIESIGPLGNELAIEGDVFGDSVFNIGQWQMF